jgi:hypothetical protein
VDNPNVTPIETEIAIPPDTAFQKVAIESINPKPKNITRDADGNWLARYDLPSGGGIDVSVQLLIALFLSPRPDYRGELIDEGAYLQPLKYWETQNPKILDVARQYTTPRQIYDYVVSTLTYSYDRVNETPARMGAAEAISRPDQAICMEFTDLFIAIARAAGIPARENVGFAYTTNAKLRPLSLVTDVLHAWPEYYDNEQKVWIPVDPTWANTTGGVNYFDKLDFNHIVFAIHGRESDYPYPAGFYRRVGKTGKDVLVSFAPSAETSLKGILTTEINLPSRVTAGLPVNGTVIVKNDGGIAVDEAVIDIVGTPGNLTLRRIEQNLPPLSRVNIPVRLEFTNILANTQGTITVAVNGDETYRMFEIRPMYWLIIPVSIALGWILMLAWVISRRHLWIRKRIS